MRPPTAAALFFRGLQAWRRQPLIYVRSGFELAQFAFQKIAMRSWLRFCQFRYDAGFLRVHVLVEYVGIRAWSSHGTLTFPAQIGRERNRRSGEGTIVRPEPKQSQNKS